MGYKIILRWLTGALFAKATSSLRVCTCWSKPSFIKYGQIKKNVHSPTKSKHITGQHIDVQILIESD